MRIELTHKGFADLSLTTWVPRLNPTIIAKIFAVCQSDSSSIAQQPGKMRPQLPAIYFFAGSSICASRRKRADSSGGVGLM